MSQALSLKIQLFPRLSTSFASLKEDNSVLCAGLLLGSHQYSNHCILT